VKDGSENPFVAFTEQKIAAYSLTTPQRSEGGDTP